MRRFLKWFLLSLFSLIGVVVVALFIFIQKPERILTPQRLGKLALYGQNRLEKNEKIGIQWGSLDLEIHSHAFFRKEILIRAANLCIQTPEVKACFDTLKFRALTTLKKSLPALAELGPIEIVSQNLQIDLSHPTPPSAPSTKPSIFSVPSWLADTRFLPFKIDFLPWRVQLTEKEKYRGTLTVRTPHQEGNDLKLQLNASTHYLQRDVQITALLGLAPRKLQALLNLDIDSPHSEKPQLSVHDCKVGLTSPDGEVYRNLSVHCPVDLNVVNALAAAPKARKKIPEVFWASFQKADFPKQIDLTIDSQLEGSLLPYDPKVPLKGTATAEMVPFKSRVLEAHAKVETIWNGSPRGNLDLSLAIHDYTMLANDLKHTPYEIPAPLAVLNGNIVLESNAAFDLKEAHVPLRLTTTLHSPTEDLNTVTQADLTISQQKTEANIDVLLSKIRLELPKLALAAPPRIFPDSRITNKPRKPSNSNPSSRFHYTAHIHTADNQPVLIASNLAHKPIPIALDVKMTDATPPSGKISIEPFPLNLFQRDVQLKSFDMTLASPVSDSELTGEIDVNYVDYDIKVQIVNTVSKPKVILSSSPPLPDDEIVAVLLFGTPPDELDSDQTSSVGNTQAAIADGALGLGSLYLLASTPIQSVNYDPTTGVVTAKVKLGKGTSLNLGADQNQLAQTGVRQRLGGHWSIETDINNPTDSENRTLSALLVWSLRY